MPMHRGVGAVEQLVGVVDVETLDDVIGQHRRRRGAGSTGGDSTDGGVSCGGRRDGAVKGPELFPLLAWLLVLIPPAPSVNGASKAVASSPVSLRTPISIPETGVP